MMPDHGDEADEVEGGPKMKMDRGGMQQMTAGCTGGVGVVLLLSP